MKMVNACLSLQKSKKRNFLSRMFSLPGVKWRKRQKESQWAENVFVSWFASAHI